TSAVQAQARPFTLVSEPVGQYGTILVTYDPGTGHVRYEAMDHAVTIMELWAASGRFDPTSVHPNVLSGPFDLLTPFKFFKLVNNEGEGTRRVDIGPILPLGMSAETLLADISADAVLATEDRSPDLYLYVVPEPSGFTFSCGVLMALILNFALVRKRRANCGPPRTTEKRCGTSPGRARRRCAPG